MCQPAGRAFPGNPGINFHKENQYRHLYADLAYITIRQGFYFRYIRYIPFCLQINHLTMRSILYLIAVILIIGWLLGVFVYSATGLIHILIVLAIVALLLGIIRRA